MNSFARSLAALRGKPAPPDPEPPNRPAGLPEPVIRSTGLSLAARAEADVCDLLGAWLIASGYEIFYEVPLGRSRPDVVGVRADGSVGIEAKLEAVDDVVRQGIRIARRFDRPYVALPPIPAAEATRLLTRLTRERPGLALPGVLAVTREVSELMAPSTHPRRPVSLDELRRLGQLHGTPRGGLPGGSAFERDVRLWIAAAEGESLAALSARADLSSASLRSVLRRINEAREHAGVCPGERACPEAGGAMGEARLKVVHRYAERLRDLPAPDEVLRRALR